MSERAAYSRIYWSVMDDSKFDGIREDVRLFGSWSLLLVIADMAHPAPAYLPRTVPKAAITKLAEVGLIDLLGGHRYRVHGLDAERERRRASATTRGPSGDRPGIKRDPLGQLDEAEAETRQRRERDEAPREDDREDLEAYLLVTRRAPTQRQRALLDGLLDRHDLTGPKWAADIMLRNPDDPIGAVIAADKEYRAERIAEAQKAEKPKPQPRRPKGIPEHSRELLAHWAAEEQRKSAERKAAS